MSCPDYHRCGNGRLRGIIGIMADNTSVADHGSASDTDLDAAMREHYEGGREAGRLADLSHGWLEYERTKEILLRALPPAPAVVADIGGGPGRYALWLAELGYQVVHRDIVPLHVQQLREAAGPDSAISSALGDARDLDLADASVDAVLLLGPLYHLDADDRQQALREAGRVVRPGGPVFGAAISRWAPRLDGILRERLYEEHPGVIGMVETVERTGILEPLFPGAFSAFLHRPAELRAEVLAAGLEVTDLVCVEGAAFLLLDLAQRITEETARRMVLDAARALERVPELMGVGPHLLVTARRS
jgi:SAM-dependent methyltransferase